MIQIVHSPILGNNLHIMLHSARWFCILHDIVLLWFVGRILPQAIGILLI